MSAECPTSGAANFIMPLESIPSAGKGGEKKKKRMKMKENINALNVLKRMKLRPWVRSNCPATDETFPSERVKRPLGRSWVLSQFANSVLSFVTVGLLITIPHSLSLLSLN